MAFSLNKFRHPHQQHLNVFHLFSRPKQTRASLHFPCHIPHYCRGCIKPIKWLVWLYIKWLRCNVAQSCKYLFSVPVLWESRGVDRIVFGFFLVSLMVAITFNSNLLGNGCCDCNLQTSFHPVSHAICIGTSASAGEPCPLSESVLFDYLFKSTWCLQFVIKSYC